MHWFEFIATSICTAAKVSVHAFFWALCSNQHEVFNINHQFTQSILPHHGNLCYQCTYYGSGAWLKQTVNQKSCMQ